MLGRLANYKYINMDIAVKNAMDLFDKMNDIDDIYNILNFNSIDILFDLINT